MPIFIAPAPLGKGLFGVGVLGKNLLGAVSSSTATLVFPNPATGTGAGVGSSITIGSHPGTSTGNGAGPAPLIGITPHPSASAAFGVGVNPQVTTGFTQVFPTPAMGTGVGVTPTVTVFTPVIVGRASMERGSELSLVGNQQAMQRGAEQAINGPLPGTS